jgi:NAD(P)-dependent dehydrogenase (short-subunit alcohol dehydrogenase family)
MKHEVAKQMGQPEGKLSLVTGGAGDLGIAIARSLAVSGSRVVLADVDGELAREAAAELSAHGHRVGFIPMDVTNECCVTAAFEQVSRDHGKLDILPSYS